jgi:hypothetical protein
MVGRRIGALTAKRNARPRPAQKNEVPKIKGLTTKDVAKMRAAYLDAYTAENARAEVDKFYAKYTDLYAISKHDLSRLAATALSEMHREKRERKQERKQGRGDLDPKSQTAKKAKKRRNIAVERPDPTGLEAANVRTMGRPTVRRARFIRGGLPGLGKR